LRVDPVVDNVRVVWTLPPAGTVRLVLPSDAISGLADDGVIDVESETGPEKPRMLVNVMFVVPEEPPGSPLRGTVGTVALMLKSWGAPYWPSPTV
jgi:hypothetical protein